MSEKPKRKRGAGHRFKTLFFVIILLGLVIALSNITVYLLRPHGSYIVYLASNEHGFSTLWKADLENPEHPKQLVFFPPNVSVLNYQITDDGHYIFYSFGGMGSSVGHMTLLDTHNGGSPWHISCNAEGDECSKFKIRPDGRYIAYSRTNYERTSEDEIKVDSMSVHVIDTDTFSDTVIHQIELPESNNRFHDVSPSWMGNTGLLTYSLPEEPHQIQVYDVEQNLPLDLLPSDIGSPIFSDDGSRFAYHEKILNTEHLVIEVRETNTPDRLISWSNRIFDDDWVSHIVYDWHPDNEHLLIGNYRNTLPDAAPGTVSNLQLLNTTDGSIMSLTEGERYSYTNATFNHDGSKILYQRKDTLQRCSVMTICDQIMIYDMETGEHTALPIIGSSPQWVNGGRG